MNNLSNSFVLIGIFTSYICMYFILASVSVSVRVCLCIYFCVRMNILCLYL